MVEVLALVVGIGKCSDPSISIVSVYKKWYHYIPNNFDCAAGQLSKANQQFHLWRYFSSQIKVQKLIDTGENFAWDELKQIIHARTLFKPLLWKPCIQDKTPITAYFYSSPNKNIPYYALIHTAETVLVLQQKLKSTMFLISSL